MNTMVEYLNGKGVDTSLVKVKVLSPGDRRLGASKDIKEGSTICFIPFELFVTEDDIINSPTN